METDAGNSQQSCQFYMNGNAAQEFTPKVAAAAAVLHTAF